MSYYSDVVLADNPIRYYRLNETSGTTAVDSGSDGINGTLHGTITLNQASGLPGISDGNMLFDGSTGYISCPTFHPATTTLTLECWVYSSNYVQSGMMLEVATVNAFAEMFFEVSNLGGTGLKLRGASGSSQVWVANPANSAWHHIVGTFNGTAGILYVDGVATSGTITQIPTSSSTLYIGCYDASAYFFSGSMSQVAVYATTLSATRVKAHYDAGIHTRIIPATAALLSTSTRTISSVTAALSRTSTRTIGSNTAALQATATRTIPCTAALQATSKRTIPASAALSLTSTRTIPNTAALQLTGTRTIPCTASLSGALVSATRTIPTSAALSIIDNARTIPASCSLALYIALFPPVARRTASFPARARRGTSL